MAAPNKDQFLEIVADMISTSGLCRVRRKDKVRFALELQTQQGLPKMFFLANSYKEYCKAKEESRPEVLQRHCGAVVGVVIPPLLSEASSRLYPLLQSRCFFEDMNFGRRPEDPLYVPFTLITADLAVGLVYDTPFKVMYINQGKIDVWRSDFAPIYNIAIQNLRKSSQPVLHPTQGGLFVGNWGDAYGASRLIFTDFFKNLEVLGRPIAMAVDATTVLVTGEDDANNMVVLTKFVEEMKDGGSLSISMAPLILHNDQWHPFVTPNESIFFPFVNYLNLLVRLKTYSRMNEVLKARTANPADFHVLEECDTGSLTSACAWSQGTTPLLPLADNVLFKLKTSAGADTTRAAPWSAVEAVIGDLFQRTGIYPEYLQPKRFPSDAELNVIFKGDPRGEYLADFVIHTLGDVPGARSIACQLGVRPCPGAIPVGTMQCSQEGMLQGFKCPVAFETVVDFFQTSLKNTHISHDSDKSRQSAFFSKAGMISDVYVYVVRFKNINATTIFVEVQHLDVHLIEQRISDLMSGKIINLAGPRLMNKGYKV